MSFYNIIDGQNVISPRQIKAARALLDWTQADLASATGLHFNAINKVENGLGEPRTSTLERIKIACENSGIRFRGQRGVELKEDIFELVRYEGSDFIRHLTDDTLAILQTSKDEIVTCLIDEQLFNTPDRKQSERYYKAMKKTGFRERYIVSRKQTNFMNDDKSVYRWLPEKIMGTVAYSVYGNRTAFINWGTHEILIIKNKSLAATFRRQFEFLWSQAKIFS